MTSGRVPGAATETFDGSEPLDVREYQLELLQHALQDNVIAYLETGAGKTLIAVLLAKQYATGSSDLAQQPQQVVCCLVPTVILVAQQADAFRRFLGCAVGEYTGASGVDQWSAERWRTELQGHGVLVMTPQILLDCLSLNFIAFKDISLLILDEAHHCRKRTPYAKVMEQYRRLAAASRPRVFGMTASPVNVGLPPDQLQALAKIRESVRELEHNMCARVVTVADLTGVRQAVPTPKTDHLYHLPATTFETSQLPAALKAIAWSALRLTKAQDLARLQHKQAELDRRRGEAPLEEFDDDGDSSRAKRIGSWLGNCLAHSLHTQGPYCAALLAIDYLSNVSGDGTLSSLGTLSPQELAYASVGDTKRWHKSSRQDASAALAKVKADVQALQAELQANAMTMDDVADPTRVIRESLFLALQWLIRMLVWDEVLCKTLTAAARTVVLPTQADAEPSTRAMAALLEAALAAVPADLLESWLLSGPQAARAKAWRDHMSCDLLMPKVCALMAELHRHRDVANASMPPGQRQGDAQDGSASPGSAASSVETQRPASRAWAALVFAQRRTCVVALHHLVERLPNFKSFLRCAPLTGEGAGLSTNNQAAVLRGFKEGTFNLLFTTSIAEEGIDVQHCSLVICFDPPVRPLSLVQMVGRARAQNSRVVFMTERRAGGVDRADHVKAMQRYVEQTREHVLLRTALEGQAAESADAEDMPVIQMPGEEQSIPLDEMTSVLNRYCQALAAWHIYMQSGLSARGTAGTAIDVSHLRVRKITNDLRTIATQSPCFQVTLYLPRGCPIRCVTGPPARSKRLARANASAAAVLKLFDANLLDAHFRPILEHKLRAIHHETRRSDFDVTTRLIAGLLSSRDLPPSWTIQTWCFPGSDRGPHKRGRACERGKQHMRVLQGAPFSLWPTAPPTLQMSAPPLETAGYLLYCFSLHAKSTSADIAAQPPSAFDSSAAGDAAPSPQRQHGSHVLLLGFLVKRRLPDLPAFDVWMKNDAGNGYCAMTCTLVCAGEERMLPGSLRQAQAFHSGLMQTLFDCDTGETLDEADLVSVVLTPRKHESVSVMVKARRVARFAGVQVHNSDGPVGLQQGNAVHSTAPAPAATHAFPEGDPIPEDLWVASSGGAWYAVVPVSMQPDSSRSASESEPDRNTPRIDWDLIRSFAQQGLSQTASQTLREAFEVLRSGSGAPSGARWAAKQEIERALSGRVLRSRHANAPFTYAYHRLSTNTLSSVMPEYPGKRQKTTLAAETFKDYYSTRYGLSGLCERTPLLCVSRWSGGGAGSSCLLPRDPVHPAQRDIHPGATSPQSVSSLLGALSLRSPSSDGSVPGGVKRSTPDSTHSSDARSAPSAWDGPELPAELCFVHPLPAPYFHALAHVPSLMYRVEGLLMAHELRGKLAPAWLPREELPPVDRVLEAITHRSCRDVMDFERYELLGDSFFKFASAKNIYGRFAHEKTEGGMALLLHKNVSNGSLLRASAMTRYHNAPDSAPLGELHGVLESIRVTPYALAYFCPPGLLEKSGCLQRKVAPKVGADVMEALAGVFYESLGPARTACWLATLGLLPGHETVPGRTLAARRQELGFVQRIRAQVAQNAEGNDAATCLTVRDGLIEEAYCPMDAFMASQGDVNNTGADRTADAPASPTEPDTEADAEAARERAQRGKQEYLKMVRNVLQSRGAWDGGPLHKRPVRLTIGSNAQAQLPYLAPHEVPHLLPSLSADTVCVPSAPRAAAASSTAELLSDLSDRLHRSSIHEVLRCLHAAERLQAAGPSLATRSRDHPEQAQAQYHGLPDILGHTFADPCLARTACVHGSWVNREEETYERLEFIGDAVLDLIVTSYIFYALGADRAARRVAPQQLTVLRSALVKNDTLAFLSCLAGLDRCLLHSSPSLQARIAAFSQAVDEKMRLKQAHPVAENMSNVLYVATGSGMGYMEVMDCPKALGDIFEASIGAVFVDSGLNIAACYPVVMRLLHGLRGITPSTFPMHPFLLINALASQRGLPQPRFAVVQVASPAQPAQRLSAQRQAQDRNERRFKGRAFIANAWLTDVMHGATRQHVRVRCAEAVLSHVRRDSAWLDALKPTYRGDGCVQILSSSAGVCTSLQRNMHAQDVGSSGATSEACHSHARDERSPASKPRADHFGSARVLPIAILQTIHDADIEAERAMKWSPNELQGDDNRS